MFGVPFRVEGDNLSVDGSNPTPTPFLLPTGLEVVVVNGLGTKVRVGYDRQTPGKGRRLQVPDLVLSTGRGVPSPLEFSEPGDLHRSRRHTDRPDNRSTVPLVHLTG